MKHILFVEFAYVTVAFTDQTKEGKPSKHDVSNENNIFNIYFY